MTLPNEEYYSLVAAKNFLYDLLNPAHTPKLPSEIRERAARVLKHFPMQHRLNEIYKDHVNTKHFIVSENHNGDWTYGKDE